MSRSRASYSIGNLFVQAPLLNPTTPTTLKTLTLAFKGLLFGLLGLLYLVFAKLMLRHYRFKIEVVQVPFWKVFLTILISTLLRALKVSALIIVQIKYCRYFPFNYRFFRLSPTWSVDNSVSDRDYILWILAFCSVKRVGSL